MNARHRAILSLAVTLTALTGWANGGMVVEWWGQADYCRYKGMTIAPAAEGGHALTFDLSPVPKDAKVYHASLRVHTKIRPVRTDKRAYMNAFGKGVFYYDPFRLYNEIRPDKLIEIHVAGGGKDPLRLEGPQFKSFDATEAVRAWVGDRRAWAPLAAALRDEDDSISEQAAQALGVLGDVRGVDPLIAALKAKDGDVRFIAAEALAARGESHND